MGAVYRVEIAKIRAQLLPRVAAVICVVAPLGFDQPGNAARVEYHGLGRRVDVKRSTREQLTRVIRAVLFEPSYRRKISRFRDASLTLEPPSLAADVIEAILHRPTSATYPRG